MLKSLLTMLLAVFLLIGATFAEQIIVQNTFKEFEEVIEQTYAKLMGDYPSKLDANGLEKFWLEKKRRLHVWIPHSEIKEIDLWVSECVAYTQSQNFKEAVCKLEVLKTLTSQIPNNFSLKLENLF